MKLERSYDDKQLEVMRITSRLDVEKAGYINGTFIGLRNSRKKGGTGTTTPLKDV